MPHLLLYKEKRRKSKRVIEAALTYGFWHSFGISYEESMIERRSNGKPYYIGNENEIFFNLSHGQELIAVACADCEVGIDAESMRKVVKMPCKEPAHEKKWEWLQQSEQKELDFLQPLDIERKLYENDRQRIFHSTGNDRIYTG